MSELPQRPEGPEENDGDISLWIEELLSRQPDNSIKHINDYIDAIKHSS